MNILIEQLPTTVTVNEEQLVIDTDFRTCLKVILAFEDPELTTAEKYEILIENLYETRPPVEYIEQALEAAIDFLDGPNLPSSENPGKRLYSFEKDAVMIFSAFNQTHRVDLTNVQNMHWWKFLALFMDLGTDTSFCSLVSLRSRLKNGTATKEEKKYAAKMSSIINLEDIDTRTLEEREREREFMEKLGSGL